MNCTPFLGASIILVQQMGGSSFGHLLAFFTILAVSVAKFKNWRDVTYIVDTGDCVRHPFGGNGIQCGGGTLLIGGRIILIPRQVRAKKLPGREPGE